MGTYRSVWLKYEKISIFSTSKKKGGSSKKKGGVKKGGVLFFEEDRMQIFEENKLHEEFVGLPRVYGNSRSLSESNLRDT